MTRKREKQTRNTATPLTVAIQIEQIPLSNLRLSPANVRKTPPARLNELAESLAHVGQLQNLVVTQADDGTYNVEAGGRRLAAFHLLLDQQRIGLDHLVSCQVVLSSVALTASLTENCLREDMHPADQFEAFKALVESGLPIEDVAARFGVTPLVVQRRLKLANISTRLMADYRLGKVSLEQLMALAITDNHELQESAFYDGPEWQRHPNQLRSRLTQEDIDASNDPVAAFVTVAAYEAAGGEIRRDLFADDNHGLYITDGELLERLAREKLNDVVPGIAGQGWAWVDVAPRVTPYDLSHFAKAPRVSRAATEEEQAQIAIYQQCIDAINDQLYGDDNEELSEEQYDALDTERDRLVAVLETLEDSLFDFASETRAIAGVIVSVDSIGGVAFHRGLIRREDMVGDKAVARTGVAESIIHTLSKPKNEVSEKLAQRLTSHRTAALQISLARQPHVALAALVHGMVQHIMEGSFWHDLPLGVRVTQPQQLDTHAPELPTSPAKQALDAMMVEWQQRLPADSDALFDTLLAMPQDELLALLALCAGLTVDAISASGRCSKGDRLARALDLDMRAWWSPTVDNYFAHITKPKILEAIQQFAPDQVAELSGLKKADLAQAAERLVAGTGWLPAQMLTPPAPIGQTLENEVGVTEDAA